MKTLAFLTRYVYHTYMHKKLTITVDEAIYKGLRERIGPGKISQFIEDLVRPHVIRAGLDDAYEKMARDEQRETEALKWSEDLIGDVADDPR